VKEHVLENRGIAIHDVINLLKPTGYVMHQQFNIQQLYVLPTVYLCVLYLSENSNLCHLQHKLIGFYNRYEKCLQRGTDWVFKLSSLSFVFKGLTCIMEDNLNTLDCHQICALCVESAAEEESGQPVPGLSRQA